MQSNAVNHRKKVGFLDEDNGNHSAMRLMCFISLIAAIIFGSITIIKPEAKDVGTNLTLVFVVGAFAPKAIQKFAEQRLSVSDNSRSYQLENGRVLRPEGEYASIVPDSYS